MPSRRTTNNQANRPPHDPDDACSRKGPISRRESCYLLHAPPRFRKAREYTHGRQHGCIGLQGSIGSGSSGWGADKSHIGGRCDQQVHRAAGGLSAIQSVSSRVEGGTVTFGDGPQFPVEILANSPLRQAMTIHLPVLDSSTIFDNQNGWVRSLPALFATCLRRTSKAPSWTPICNSRSTLKDLPGV